MSHKNVNYSPMLGENEKNRIFHKKKILDIFFIVSVITVTLLSLIYFIYSFIDIPCTKIYWGGPNFNFITWMLVYSITTFFYSGIIIFAIFYMADITDDLQYQTDHPYRSEDCHKTFIFYLKIFYVTLNIFLLSWISFGFYLFSDHYRFICGDIFFTYYVWFSIFLGFLIHLFFIGLFTCSLYTTSDRERKFFTRSIYTF